VTSQTSEEELLTTGEVAALLGTTRRHVVNLCQRGELAYTMAGTHRRIRRGDAMALAGRAAADRGGPLTTDQLRSLWLHRAVAAHVAQDPSGTLTQAGDSVQRLLSRDPNGARWLRQWLGIIDRGPEAVMRALTSTGPMARELRQNSPWLSLLTPSEREKVLHAFSSASKRGVRLR